MGTAIPLTSQVFKMAMWMRLWGGSSPKRTLLVSNGKAIFKLWTGRLVRSQNPSSVKTTKRYRDRSGKVRFQGTSSLKSTQPLDLCSVSNYVLPLFKSVLVKWHLPIRTGIVRVLFTKSFSPSQVVSCCLCWTNH